MLVWVAKVRDLCQPSMARTGLKSDCASEIACIGLMPEGVHDVPGRFKA